MKILNKFLFLFIGCLALSSCDDKGDVFTGSPADTDLEKVTLTGVISSPVTEVSASQPFELTVTMPQSFDVNVKLEATAFLPNTNKRRTTTVILPAGQTTITFQARAAGTDNPDLPYDNNMQVYLSAITTDPVDTVVGFPGKQYSLTSNMLNMNWGDAIVAGADKSVLSVYFDFIGPHYVSGSTPPPYNGLNFRIRKNGVLIPGVLPQNSGSATSSTSIYGKSNYTQRNFNWISILNVANNGSVTDGTYVMEIYAAKLVSSPMDVDMRFTVRYPDDDDTVKTFRTSMTNMVVGPATSAIAKLKIIKTTLAGVPQYAVTVL